MTKQTTVRSGGWFFAISASGCIGNLGECMGTESITLRYMFVAHCYEILLGLEFLVHDEACHLCRFALLRGGHSDMAKKRSKLRYIIDPFDFKEHVWKRCLENCAPTLPASVNASVCEHRFSDLGHKRGDVNATETQFGRFSWQK